MLRHSFARSFADSSAGRIRRSTLRIAAATTVATLLAACGTAPLSFINDRQVYYRAQINRYPVFVVAIDGKSPSFRPVPITVGDHVLTLDAQPVAGFAEPVKKTYPMTVAACTRYYIAAQRTSPLLQDWELVVERTFPVAGCDPAKELEKARIAAARGEQPPLSSSIDSSAAVAALQSTPSDAR